MTNENKIIIEDIMISLSQAKKNINIADDIISKMLNDEHFILLNLMISKIEEAYKVNLIAVSKKFPDKEDLQVIEKSKLIIQKSLDFLNYTIKKIQESD